MSKTYSKILDFAGKPVFGGLTAGLGAIVGLIGGLYPDQIKSAFPFGLGTDFVWQSLVFWISLFLFGWFFKLNVEAQNRAQNQAISRLHAQSQSQIEALDALSGNATLLNELVRTMPPKDFLREAETYVRLAYRAATDGLAGDSSDEQIVTGIHSCLAALLTLTWRFENSPKDATYSINYMGFEKMSSASEAANRRSEIRFIEPFRDLSTLDGVLVLEAGTWFELTPEGVIRPSTVDQLPALTLPILAENVRTYRGRSMVLPGAPEAFCNPETAELIVNTRELGAIVQQRTGIDHNVATDISEFFDGTNGRRVGSFLSLALALPGSDGRLTAPVGVVNINCSREGLLNGERVNLFVPVIAPLRFLLAELLLRTRQPPDKSVGTVIDGAGVS